METCRYLKPGADADAAMTMIDDLRRIQRNTGGTPSTVELGADVAALPSDVNDRTPTLGQAERLFGLAVSVGGEGVPPRRICVS